MKVELIDHGYTTIPNRAHYNDSGADIYAIEDVVLPARKVTSVRTGLGARIPDGYDLVVHCKSGLSNKGIWASNSPVDAGYTGDIHAILFNTTDKDFVIKRGEKIGQLVMRPVIYCDFVEKVENNRGAGAFGSTGK